MKIIFTIITLFFFLGCSTIEIRESDAFDNHQTITPDSFQFSQYTLHETSIDTEDGETLNAWFLEHRDAKATVLYLGGNGFLMLKSKPLINAYSELPVNLLLFDYRGYGLSSGQPTVDGVIQDANAALEYATTQTYSHSDQIYIHGHSMGSFLSSHLAYNNRVNGYILESPITEVKEWTRSLVPWLLRPFIRFVIDDSLTDQSNIEKVSHIEYPLLLIAGRNDEVTPFRMAESLKEKSASESVTLAIIDGGSHNNLPAFQAYQAALREFLGFN